MRAMHVEARHRPHREVIDGRGRLGRVDTRIRGARADGHESDGLIVPIREEPNWLSGADELRHVSAIAFAVTGTRWNGHRFFGLRDKTGLIAKSRP